MTFSEKVRKYTDLLQGGDVKAARAMCNTAIEESDDRFLIYVRAHAAIASGLMEGSAPATQRPSLN